ncbi:MAG: DUF1674 domain-containing protein [Rhodospirillum sp.]|nr:DUF1674 domain-containing protein [Rhodospirillum sp.]
MINCMTKPDSTVSRSSPNAAEPVANAPADPGSQTAKRPREIGGPSGPEPTRYGDWERNGRVSDF